MDQKSILLGTLRGDRYGEQGFLISSAAEAGRFFFEVLRIQMIILAIQIDKILLQNLKISACGALAFSFDYFRSLPLFHLKAKKEVSGT